MVTHVQDLTTSVGTTTRITGLLGRFNAGLSASGGLQRKTSRHLTALAAFSGKAARGFFRSFSALAGVFSSVVPVNKGAGPAGPFNILLPGGDAVVIKAPLALVLPLPATGLTAFTGTIGTFNITLPAPVTGLAGQDYHSAFNITLPPLATSMAGTDWYGRLAIVLPPLKTALSAGRVRSGPFSILFGKTPVMLRRMAELRKLAAPPAVPVEWTGGSPKVSWKAGVAATEWNVAYSQVQVNHLGTEYVLVPISASKNGAAYDPGSDVVEFAFMPTPTSVPGTGDWKAGAWETVSTSLLYPYNAKCLVGPNGVITLTPGNYYIYVQIQDNPETPVLSAGMLTIT